MIPEQKKEKAADETKIKVDDKWTEIPPGLSKDSKVLVVNDISRTSHTLERAVEFLKERCQSENIQSATLICHKQAPTKPTHYVAVTRKTIQFDWKRYDQ